MRRGEPLGFRWSYVDLLWALVIVFMAMSVFSLIASRRQNPTKTKLQGDVVITLHWDLKSNSDIDLWVKAPGDRPVGFSDSTGKHCDLLRDDLGRESDSQSRNEEMTICRGIDAGEWVVNVMAYNVYDHKFPVQATVHVSVVADGVVDTVFEKTVSLTRTGQQITVGRFTLDKNGLLVDGSVNDLPMKLYPY